MDTSYYIEGQIVDVIARSIFPGQIEIVNGRIAKIRKMNTQESRYIMPGFIDAHIHIESSMVVPYEFARVAVCHGTVSTISDPHEIANVLGMEGIQYMIDNAKDAPFKFFFGAPSCVPATEFETSGARIGIEEVKSLLESDDIYYLSEMMNYPGVLMGDKVVMEKIRLAHKSGKPIDGHAPGLRGDNAKMYIKAGISTDHECFTLEEAKEKLSYGMRIIIREGSAARNFEALHPLIARYGDHLMFCSDDKHPDDLMEGHINVLVRESIELGYELFDVLKMACVNPVEHYGLKVGLLQEGDPADFIVVDDLQSFNVAKTFIDGQLVFDGGDSKMGTKSHAVINNFNIGTRAIEDFKLSWSEEIFPVIVALDGEIVTERENIAPLIKDGLVQSDIDRDLLKICVVNRYTEAKVSVGLIRNVGLKTGALASTVGHDCHNIIVVGVDDESICQAVNLLVKSGGGLSAVGPEENVLLPLPIAGLMSDLPCEEVASRYAQIDQFVKNMGCTLSAPYMTLSFMALLVIPKIKMSDKGIFDAEKFQFLSEV